MPVLRLSLLLSLFMCSSSRRALAHTVGFSWHWWLSFSMAVRRFSTVTLNSRISLQNALNCTVSAFTLSTSFSVTSFFSVSNPPCHTVFTQISVLNSSFCLKRSVTSSTRTVCSSSSEERCSFITPPTRACTRHCPVVT